MEQANSPKLLEIEKRLRAAQETGWWKYHPEYPMFVGTTNGLCIYELGTIDLGRTRKPCKDEDEEDRRTRELIQGLGVFLENCREDMAWLIACVRNLVRENQDLRIALSAAGQTKDIEQVREMEQ